MSDKPSDKKYKVTLTENQLALVGTAVEGMMNDLISRQAAIDALTALEEPASTARHLRAIKALPSAQPQRKKGRWIDMDDHVMCSCCGATHYGSDKNFCPNCGAKMDGERSE